MPEKELTKRLTRLLKDADKFVQDIQKNTARITESLAELKKLTDRKEDDEQKPTT